MGKIPLCLPVKQCLVTGYQFRQLEKLILRLKILFPSLEFLQRHDWFCVFNSCMCESPPSLFPSAELARRSRPLSPCEAFSASLTLWNVLALPHPVERSRPLSVERSRPLTLWNILTVSHPVERSRPLSPCRTFSPSLILWELCPPGHLGNVL